MTPLLNRLFRQRFRAAFGFVFLLSVLALPARADFINGRQLSLYCTSQNPSDDAICIVYITGAVDAFTTMDLIAQKTQGETRKLCLPDGIQPDQLRATTLDWLERPDTDLDFAATLLVLGAMQDAYGCDR
ncbi:Rap1a/Tai family immunity protein [Alphaproteobacteria bacterium LSUCC0684]